jgi:hypothetical protein
MEDDRRNKEIPVPANLREYLNDFQMLALDRMKGLGWELKFIRHPIFQQPVPVIVNRETDEHAMIEEDGTINKKPFIDIR